MRMRSALWERITKRGNFDLQTKAVIGGTEYTEISAPKIDRQLMTSPLSIGNCNTASMEVSILTNDVIYSTLPVVIMGRVTDGTDFSEWMPFGTFYINQRDTSYEGLVTISCYDAMLKASQLYITPLDNPTDWPKDMTTVVSDIADRIGVDMDPRSNIESGADYVVPFPTNLTMMQVLGYIGACHGGNWIITEENRLRLVPLVTAPDETFYVIDYDYNHIQTDDGHTLIHGIQTQFNPVLPGESPGLINVPAVLGNASTGTSVTVTGVSMDARNGVEGYIAGNSGGFVIDLGQNPYATPEICEDLLENYGGLVYSPFSATGTIYDPATELGDQVKIGDMVFSVIMAAKLSLDILFQSDISAPNNEELSSEYPYLSEYKTTLNDLSQAIESAAEQIDEMVEISTDVESLQAVLTAEINRASGVEAGLADRISGEVSRASGAEQENARGITALDARVTTAEDDIDGHASRILALEGTVAQHTSDITALWDEVFDLKDRVAALDGGPDSGRTPPNP